MLWLFVEIFNAVVIGFVAIVMLASMAWAAFLILLFGGALVIRLWWTAQIVWHSLRRLAAKP